MVKSRRNVYGDPGEVVGVISRHMKGEPAAGLDEPVRAVHVEALLFIPPCWATRTLILVIRQLRPVRKHERRHHDGVMAEFESPAALNTLAEPHDLIVKANGYQSARLPVGKQWFSWTPHGSERKDTELTPDH